MRGRYNQQLLAVLVLAVGVRLWRFGSVPVSTLDNPVMGRVSFVILSILSVYMLYRFASVVAGNRSVGIWSAFWLAVNPWHIAEGRIVSEPTVALAGLLAVLLVVSTYKNAVVRAIAGVSFIVSMAVLYPGAWIWNIPVAQVSVINAVKNFFDLFSGTFLFFANDTFWWGGFREFGVFAPVTVLFLVAGVYGAFSYLSKNRRIQVVSAVLLLSVFAALSPDLPESREFFLTLPFFALIAGIGTVCLMNIVARYKKRSVLLFVIGAGLVGYQLVLQMHMYMVHYAARMTVDIININNAF